MLAPSPTPAEQPTSLVTEAEALCYLLGDLGLVPAVNLSNDTIFVTLGENPKAGALDVLNVITKRAIEDDDFREELIAAIGSSGFYLADSPSYNSDAKTWPAAQLVEALARKGLIVRHHYERGGQHVPRLSFAPVPGQIIGNNAHLLMRLVVDRFHEEPEGFGRDLLSAIIASGNSPHDA